MDTSIIFLSCPHVAKLLQKTRTLLLGRNPVYDVLCSGDDVFMLLDGVITSRSFHMEIC